MTLVLHFTTQAHKMLGGLLLLPAPVMLPGFDFTALPGAAFPASNELEAGCRCQLGLIRCSRMKVAKARQLKGAR